MKKNSSLTRRHVKTSSRKTTPGFFAQTPYLPLAIALFMLCLSAKSLLAASQQANVLGISTTGVLLADQGDDNQEQPPQFPQFEHGSPHGPSTNFPTNAQNDSPDSRGDSRGGHGTTPGSFPPISGVNGGRPAPSGQPATLVSPAPEQENEPTESETPRPTPFILIGPAPATGNPVPQNGSPQTTPTQNNGAPNGQTSTAPVTQSTSTLQAAPSPQPKNFFQSLQEVIQQKVLQNQPENQTEQPQGQQPQEQRNPNGVVQPTQPFAFPSDSDLKKINTQLEQMNGQLRLSGIEIKKAPDNYLAIVKNNVKAEVALPLAIDPNTQTLSVTTPAGNKVVNILPDEAVSAVLKNKVLTQVETETTATQDIPKTTLTSVNNEPTFIIKGVAQKRILGFLPHDFQKTTQVSATTGNVTQTDESFFDKALEVISF